MSELTQRLRTLSIAVTRGPEAMKREFDMRVPADKDRDADLVLDRAADTIEMLQNLSNAQKDEIAMLRDTIEQLQARERRYRETLEAVKPFDNERTVRGLSMVTIINEALAQTNAPKKER